MAAAGHEVVGYDVNEKVINTLSQGHIHIVENDLQEAFSKVLQEGHFRVSAKLESSDVFIISVPTPFKEGKKADISYIEAAAESVAKVLKEGDLVILESTSPAGTTRRMTDLLCQHSGLARNAFGTAHCPERVLPGKILYELRHNDRIIGSERREEAEKAKALYQSFVTEGNIYVTDDVTAEMTKLLENSFRDVNIAFANEVSMIADRLGIDAKELIWLANRHPRVNILTPGVGVGGHCISVDPWFIVEQFEEAKLIHTARQVNDYKPFWVVDKIEQKLASDKTKTVAILGLAYKPDVDDLRESPSVIIAEELKKRGYQVIACEPNVKAAEYKGIPLLDAQECVRKADAVLLAQKHKEFSDLVIESEKLVNV